MICGLPVKLYKMERNQRAPSTNVYRQNAEVEEVSERPPWVQAEDAFADHEDSFGQSL